MPLIIPANSLSSGGYSVDNSCRFNDGSSDYLSRTPASAGNRRTWTWSGWVKRSQIGGTYNNLFSAGTDSDTNGFVQCAFWGDSSDWLEVTIYNSAYLRFRTTQLFRDTSAWYHIVIGFDSTQGTNTNRVKIYVNGEQISSFATYNTLAQNFDSAVNNTEIQKVGAGSSSASSVNNYYDGYIAEAVLVDGQQLAADSFGEFDEDSGIWKPIDVSGLTFGTNGFYLDFEDSAALGDDVSGNGNDFTVNNLTAIDQTTDTPTNNYATWNPLNAYNSTTVGTLSEGNLKISGTASDGGVPSTIGVSTGKWYWETKYTTQAGGDPVVGIINSSGASRMQSANSGSVTSGSGVWCMFNLTSGGVGFQENGVFVSYPSSTLASGDILNIAIDVDAQKLWYGKNGTWYSSGNPATGANAISTNLTANETWFAYVEKRNASSVSEANFGNPPFSISSGNADGNSKGNFEYAVPSGFLSLCTANLSEVLS